MVKLKVKLVGRKVYLPKELIEKAKLPENGVCEAALVGDEVRIRRESDGKLSMSTILKGKPTSASVGRMTKAEDVEDV